MRIATKKAIKTTFRACAVVTAAALVLSGCDSLFGGSGGSGDDSSGSDSVENAFEVDGSSHDLDKGQYLLRGDYDGDGNEDVILYLASSGLTLPNSPNKALEGSGSVIFLVLESSTADTLGAESYKTFGSDSVVGTGLDFSGGSPGGATYVVESGTMEVSSENGGYAIALDLTLNAGEGNTVSLKGNYSGSLDSVDLAVSADSVDDSGANDTSGNATSFAIESTETYTIYPASDVDWFKVDITGDPHLSFISYDTLAAETQADAELTLYESDASTEITSAQSIHQDFSSLSNGTYYLKVAPGNTGAYRLAVMDGPSGLSADSYEEDDRVSTATSISPGTTQTHTYTSDDDDFFEVSLDAGETVTFETLDTDDGFLTDTEVDLVQKTDTGTETLDFDKNSGDGLMAKLSYTAESAGTYYFKVSAPQPANYKAKLSSGS